MPVQDFIIRLLADTKGASQITAAFVTLNATVERLTKGQYSLNAATGQFVDARGRFVKQEEGVLAVQAALLAQEKERLATVRPLTTATAALTQGLNAKARALIDDAAAIDADTQATAALATGQARATTATDQFSESLARLTGGAVVWNREAERFQQVGGAFVSVETAAAAAASHLASENVGVATQIARVTAALTEEQQKVLASAGGIKALTAAIRDKGAAQAAAAQATAQATAAQGASAASAAQVTAAQGAAAAAVDQFNTSLARLTGGAAAWDAGAQQFTLSTGAAASSAQVAAIAAERLAEEQAALSVATKAAVSGLTEEQQKMLASEGGIRVLTDALRRKDAAQAASATSTAKAAAAQGAAAAAVDRYNTSLAALTGGAVKWNAQARQFERLAGGTATSAQVAAIAVDRLGSEQEALAAASQAATAGLTESQRALLGHSMGAKVAAVEQVKASTAVDQFNVSLAALTGGAAKWNAQAQQFQLAAGGTASSAQVAAIATERLAREQQELTVATNAAIQGLTKEQQALLGHTMGMQQLSGQTGAASFAVLSLSQGFQDAGQFGMGMAQGIRAVTNNVQQAFQAVTFLSQSVKAQNKALGTNITTWQAFRGALAGPGGALAAFALITAAVEFFSNRSQRAKKDADALGAALKDVANVHREFVDRIDISGKRIVQVYDAATEALKEQKDALAALRAEEARAGGMGGATGRRLEEIRADIKATEDRIAISQKIIGIFGEEAKAIRDRNTALEEGRKLVTAETEAADRAAGALAALQDKIADAADELETGLNPAVKKLRQDLAMLKGAIQVGLPLEQFIARWDEAIDALDAMGVSVDTLTADTFADLLEKFGTVNAVVEAFAKGLTAAGRATGEIDALAAALAELRSVLDGGVGLSEYNADVALAEERTRQAAVIFDLLREKTQTWRDHRAEIAEFIAMLEAAGVAVEDFKRALDFETTIELEVKVPDVIEVDPPEIKLRKAPKIPLAQAPGTLPDPSTFATDIGREWAEEYDAQVASAEAANDRLMDGTIKMGQIMSQAFGGVGTAMMQLAKTGETVDKKMFATGKAFAIADAVINTAVGISRAYKDLPIWAAIPASISIAAAGAAQIATIRAAQPGSASSPKGGGSMPIGSAPQLVFGTSGNIGQFVDTGQSAAGFGGVSASVGSGLHVTVSGMLVADGRDLVAVVRDETAAQHRSGITSPLGS